MTQPGSKQWEVRFETAALQILADRLDPSQHADYLCRAQACPEHGPKCLRVVYGILLRHVHWQEADAAALAAELLNAMLPAGAAETCPARVGSPLQVV